MTQLRKIFWFVFTAAALLPGRVVAQAFNFSTLDVPCATCPGGIARATSDQGINPRGDIVGTYTDAVGGQHGFLLGDGQFTTIDVPGALVGIAGTLPTVARGISHSGEIVGSFTSPYNPPASTSVGFDSPAYCPSAGSVA